MELVNNVQVYDLEQSLKAAGYPMRTSTDWEESLEAQIKRGSNRIYKNAKAL